jgi:transcriptional regulator with XRE-family HTH domain
MEHPPLQPVRLDGARLAALRERAAVTQEAVCNAVQITRSYLSRLELGQYTSVTLDVAGRLAQYYGVSLDYLCGRTAKETLDPDWHGTNGIRGWDPLPSVPALPSGR